MTTEQVIVAVIPSSQVAFYGAIPGSPGEPTVVNGKSGASITLTPDDIGSPADGELVINVADYGAVGDGVTDDTIAIQAALDAADDNSKVQLQPGKNYLITLIELEAKNNFVFDGAGATLTLSSTSGIIGNHPGVRVKGNCTDLTIRDCTIIGDGVAASGHAGIYCTSSGLSLTNLKILNNTISEVIQGIVFSVEGALNIFNGILIQGNRLENIVGTSAGQGYGINVGSNVAASDATAYANSQVRILNNHVRNAYRHSIYHSLGSGAIISGNTIDNHRNSVGATGSNLAAINCSRSTDVTISNNVISSFYGGAIYVGGTGNDVAGPPDTVSRGISVVNNQIIRSLDTVQCITVGQTSPATATDYPDGVLIANNTVFCTGVVVPFLVINGGKHGTVTGNHVTITGAATSLTVIRLNGSGEGAGTADYTDDWFFSDTNRFVLTGNSTVVLYRLSGTELTTIKMRFETGRVSGTVSTFTSSVAITNPNITVKGAVDGLSFTGGAVLDPSVEAGPRTFSGKTVISGTTTLSGTTTVSGSTTFTSGLNASSATLTGLAAPADVQLFTSTSSWTKPTGAKVVRVFGQAGGGGGGSGARRAAGVVAGGGGGGGAGGFVDRTYQASDLSGSAITVTVGTGGAGGAAITADDTNGNIGNAGIASVFGAAAATYNWSANPGQPGAAGNNSGSAAGGAGGVGFFTGSAGGASSSTGGAGNAGANGSGAGATGGGAGGGLDTSNNASAGGAGGILLNAGISGATAGAINTTGGNGGTFSGAYGPGAGGGGGGSSVAGVAGSGGNGSVGGGGGGGGGGSRNGQNSGAGGNGADGFIVVITYF